DGLATHISPRILKAPQRLDAAAQEIEEYFAGRRQHFDLPLDHALSRGFRLTVQQFPPQVTYGHTQPYKEVAHRVGNPTASGAVGPAWSTLPLPIVVPCHRRLRSDGSVGGYIGGLEAKQQILDMESAA